MAITTLESFAIYLSKFKNWILGLLPRSWELGWPVILPAARHPTVETVRAAQNSIARAFREKRTPLSRIIAVFVIPLVIIASAVGSILAKDTRKAAKLVAYMQKIPAYKQYWQIVLLRLRYELDAADYYNFKLYLDSRSPSSYLRHKESWNLLYQLNGRYKEDNLADKFSFAKFCLEHDLPNPKTWLMPAATDQASVSDFLLALDDAEYFAKPRNGMGGRGAISFTKSGNCFECSKQSRAPDDASDVNALAKKIVRDQTQLVLQPRLRPHPDIAARVGATLCTLRVNTIKDPTSGNIEEIACWFKWPRSGAIVDNATSGGLVLLLTEDAVVKGAIEWPPRSPYRGVVTEQIEEFPSYIGLKVPLVSEAKELCFEAHKRAGLVTASWDVAITDEGPVLIEVNLDLGLRGIQMALDDGLGNVRAGRLLAQATRDVA